MKFILQTHFRNFWFDLKKISFRLAKRATKAPSSSPVLNIFRGKNSTKLSKFNSFFFGFPKSPRFYHEFQVLQEILLWFFHGLNFIYVWIMSAVEANGDAANAGSPQKEVEK